MHVSTMVTSLALERGSFWRLPVYMNFVQYMHSGSGSYMFKVLVAFTAMIIVIESIYTNKQASFLFAPIINAYESMRGYKRIKLLL